MGKIVKYMGSSDVRRLEKGETFGGQLSKEDALAVDLQWDWDNDHLLDLDEVEGLSDEVIELILEEGDFKDVSEHKRIPLNEAQKLWKGMKDRGEDVQAVNPDTGTSAPKGGKSTPTSGIGAGAGAGGTTVGGASTGGSGTGSGGSGATV